MLLHVIQWGAIFLSLLVDNCSEVLWGNYRYVAISRHKNAREQPKKIRQQPSVGALSAKFGEFVASRRHSADMSATCAAKTASTRFCRLCDVERMNIGHNFNSASRMRKIINLKSEMRGICSCKTRFLRFSRSD